MTDEIDRTLPDGTIFQDKPKLRYPEEIMTDRIEALTAEIERLREVLALVARLRRKAVVHWGSEKDGTAWTDTDPLSGEAADRIEAQAAEIERLREALEHIENYYGDGHRITELARAALGETE